MARRVVPSGSFLKTSSGCCLITEFFHVSHLGGLVGGQRSRLDRRAPADPSQGDQHERSNGANRGARVHGDVPEPVELTSRERSGGTHRKPPVRRAPPASVAILLPVGFGCKARQLQIRTLPTFFRRDYFLLPPVRLQGQAAVGLTGQRRGSASSRQGGTPYEVETGESPSCHAGSPAPSGQ